jgi:hypothetical protein
MSFAELEARVNAAVDRHLSNGVLIFTGAGNASVIVVFSEIDPVDLPAQQGQPRELARWQAEAQAANFAAVTLVKDMPCTFKGVKYAVSKIDTAHDSRVTLSLRRAA